MHVFIEITSCGLFGMFQTCLVRKTEKKVVEKKGTTHKTQANTKTLIV